MTSQAAVPRATTPSPTGKRLPKLHNVTPIVTDKEQVTQDFLDDLKAGRPRLLVISLLDSDVEQQAAALRQQRHIQSDDAVVMEMKRQAYSDLKTVFLNSYRGADLQLVRDYPSTAQLLAHISSLQVLQRLLDDPRVSHVNSPIASAPSR